MTEPGDNGPVPDPVFAHPSEAEFARLLDFYKIEWQYEPRTFVLSRYPDGNIREAFSPDFYLPGQDIYVELTTLDRSLMSAKRRKIRELRRLHPEVSVKLFDRDNFRWLLLKYGLEERSDQLIGKQALEPAGSG